MKFRGILALVCAVLAFGGIAFAQSGAVVLNSLVGSFSLPIINAGPLSAVLPLNGGTLICAGGTTTVSNTHVDAGSLVVLTLKTVGGTVAAPFIATITPATGFTVTCGGSDTSTYSYLIIG